MDVVDSPVGVWLLVDMPTEEDSEVVFIYRDKSGPTVHGWLAG